MNGLTQALLRASLTDHFHIGDVQIAEGLFAGRFLHLAFFLFFSLRFMRNCASRGYLMADVLLKFDIVTAQVPGLHRLLP